MSQIKVSDLTFSYEGSFDPVFEHVSFTLDTSWKLGFIGRNGKGKTTFLNLLMGRYEYSGSITKDVACDYFPYEILPGDEDRTADDLMDEWKPGVESWRVMRELPELSVDPELLYRPVGKLSFGEKTKVMLAVLFAGENDFLLIDEPTNHLDKEARETVKTYLSGKKGFILVSHDRDLLDACVDHVLVLQKASIEVQSGNFSSWWENKERKDAFAKAENEKHAKEIKRLKGAMDQSQHWAAKGEGRKIGYDPVKEHDRNVSTRAYIGAKTKKMESRVKAYEQRLEKNLKEQEGLLSDIEQNWDLHLYPMKHFKDRLVEARDLSLRYADSDEPLFSGLSFDIKNGDRVFLNGRNGCGKSSLIKAILASAGVRDAGDLLIEGTLKTASKLEISYISQDTSGLHGDLKTHAYENGLDLSLFLTVLRHLALERAQFEKKIEDFSEGQKKKVLIATSLLTPAHLYIWDEPLNYVDVFSRIQLEKLISKYSPTMLIVEHDVRFSEKMATKVVEL